MIHHFPMEISPCFPGHGDRFPVAFPVAVRRPATGMDREEMVEKCRQDCHNQTGAAARNPPGDGHWMGEPLGNCHPKAE